MFRILLLFFRLLLLPLSATKREILLRFALQAKELEIAKRSLELRRGRLRFSLRDKRHYSFLTSLLPSLRSALALISPETVLRWYRSLLRSYWTFPHRHAPRGRPAIAAEVRSLIRTMKNDNLSWGIKRIQGELLKVGISLDKKTISSILSHFRKTGQIKCGLTWAKFIKSHIESLFACDFFTVDTLFGARFYIFFIIHLGSRRIAHLSLTRCPSYEFVRQRIICFSEGRTERTFLIHDRSGELFQKYKLYGIRGIATSAKAPNMNAFAERFVRSVRREALDNFIVVGESQLRSILTRYVDYYNCLRPHQGVQQQVPCGYAPQANGRVISTPVLGGLHHHYTRTAA